MRKICYTELAFDCGQKSSGLKLGPSALRPYIDFIVSPIANTYDHQKFESQSTFGTMPVLRDDDLRKIDWCNYHQAFHGLKQAYRRNNLLINSGGDHSVAIATVGAFCKTHPDGIVLWIDAHADIHKPSTSPSGNLHGMPLSILMNIDGIREKYVPWLDTTVRPDQIIYLGLRDIEEFEFETLRGQDMTAFFADTIHKVGMRGVLSTIFERVQGKPVHISLDIDGIDPIWAPSTGLRVPGGLDRTDLAHLAKFVQRNCNLRSVDVVEFNPEVGSEADVLKTSLTITHFLDDLFNPSALRWDNLVSVSCY